MIVPISGMSDEYTYRATITESDITSMNRYNRIFHALRGGKIFSRADQLCTKCKCNKNSSFNDYFSLCFKSICQKKSTIKRLLWRIIIFFLFRNILISFSSISFHRSDIAFVNRHNQIFHILRAPRKNFLSNRRDIDDNSFSFRNGDKQIIRVNLHFCL